MKESNFIKYPFADQGNKTPVEVDRDPNGRVSIRDGYTPAYSNDPQAGGLYINREPFNWIMNYFTKELQALQINGINLLDNSLLTSIGYPKGARCVVWLNIKTSKLDINGANDPLCISAQVVSMKDNNQTSPYNSEALFGDWWLDDGFNIGEVRTFQVNLPTAPDGYLDLAPDEANPSYVKEIYPRIKSILGDDANSKWGFFKSTSATNFTITNPRGRFARVFSNGSSIDSGRVFDSLQSDAIRNLFAGFQSDEGYTRNDYGGRANGANIAYGCFSFGDGTQYGDKDSFKQKFSGARVQFKMDTSLQVPTTDTETGENRPYNFNQKLYIKV